MHGLLHKLRVLDNQKLDTTPSNAEAIDCVSRHNGRYFIDNHLESKCSTDGGDELEAMHGLYLAIDPAVARDENTAVQPISCVNLSPSSTMLIEAEVGLRTLKPAASAISLLQR
jgi:hypothetical protein